MKKSNAFTLIELLIVIAIIAILALIAVPNFLEAQSRAKVARAMADMKSVHTACMSYYIDHGDIFPDTNDVDTPPVLQGKNFANENPGKPFDLQVRGGNQAWYMSFHVYRIWVPLTTPLAYMTSVPLDPFSKVVPLGYDTREVGQGELLYAVMFSAGPDQTVGDWFRGNGLGNKATPYEPSNGTISRGDIWRMLVGQKDAVEQEYGWGTIW